MKGKKHTPETLAKIGRANLGKKRSAEAKARMSAARKNRPRTEKELEVLQKMSGGNVGKRYALGYKHTEDAKERIGEASRGNTFRLGKSSWNKGLKGYKRQEEHYNWRGGITNVRKRVRESVEYKEWRKDIFERDDYTCQMCSERGGQLHVDHFPTAFATVLDEIERLYGADAIYDMAMQYPKLWDRTNGRTLCIPCHKKTPTWGHRARNYQPPTNIIN